MNGTAGPRAASSTAVENKPAERRRVEFGEMRDAHLSSSATACLDRFQVAIGFRIGANAYMK